ncbi:hypothetical protein, partial [Bacteroides uniformis]|uniref:hypothetical protein n=1 Tax=Bacteroides uniformis TaxID=820 RepID=UPI0022E93981
RYSIQPFFQLQPLLHHQTISLTTFSQIHILSLQKELNYTSTEKPKTAYPTTTANTITSLLQPYVYSIPIT